MRTTKETTKLYKKLIIDEFDSFLKDVAFKKIRYQAHDDGFSIIYRREERYVLFRGSLDFRDFPYSYDIILGNGSHSFPEGDWNAIALWRIIRDNSKEDYEKYNIISSINLNDSISQIAEKIKASRELLEEYGEKFLNNNLVEFQAVRSVQNKGREPYKIYSPDKDGKYKMQYEEISSRLKEKYSK
ncbi:MAG TPA: hypothetical protein PLA27_07895 [Anaerolineales bacterium]|jgi:hypothetical protein|nr:hypothetical protein [Anaerolineales bacterium]